MKKNIFRRNALLVPLFLMACISGCVSEQPSFTQGLAERLNSDVYDCRKVDSGGVPARVTNDGIITSDDYRQWVVPAEVDYAGSTKASDLFNVCNDVTPNNSSELDLSKLPVHDAGGNEVFTAYVFADNYFEMTIDGKVTVVDPLPFTPFNSSIIKFKADLPFTLAVKAVDWEEYSGIGMETFGDKEYHAGDGGIVIVVKDSKDNIVAVSDDSWKAQTYYVSPLRTKECLVVDGANRDSSNCPEEDDIEDGTKHFAAHWTIPSFWDHPEFDDSSWLYATEYTNEGISVFNKPAFTHFTNIFDDPANDASFIWSSNVILDNVVLLRKTVE